MTEAELIRAIGPENYGPFVLDACVIAAFTPSPEHGGAPGESESSPGPTSTEENE